MAKLFNHMHFADDSGEHISDRVGAAAVAR